MNKFAALFTSIVPMLASCDSRIIDAPLQKETTMNVYDNPLTDIHGKPVEKDAFEGQVTLVVNLASKCGLTPQYEDLQGLHDRFFKQGFSVVGFPCNDFGGQEPGGAEEITACATGFGASFPIMEKVSVVEGDAQCKMYEDLFQATGALPEWNFGKYLVDQHGAPVAFFGSRIEPLSDELTDRISALLGIDSESK
jgi:glutathione peroxidase